MHIFDSTYQLAFIERITFISLPSRAVILKFRTWVMTSEDIDLHVSLVRVSDEKIVHYMYTTYIYVFLSLIMNRDYNRWYIAGCSITRNITVTSHGCRWGFELPTGRLFVQPVHVNNKENIKTPHHCLVSRWNHLDWFEWSIKFQIKMQLLHTDVRQLYFTWIYHLN